MLLWASFTGKAVAADVHVTPVVLQSFQQTFLNATGVQWSLVDRLYKADFSVDGEMMTAFFSTDDGTLVAYSRYLTIPKLPLVLQRTLKMHITSGTLIGLFEVQSDNSLDYYATVQKQDGTVILKAASKNWSVYKKQ